MADNVAEKIMECRDKAGKAMMREQLALSAFNVACARHDWATAEQEEAVALDAMRTHMDAIQAIYRFQEAI